MMIIMSTYLWGHASKLSESPAKTILRTRRTTWRVMLRFLLVSQLDHTGTSITPLFHEV